MSSNLGKIPRLTSEPLIKTPYNLGSTLAPSFLIGSSSYLQVTRISKISRTNLNISQIRLRTAELAALERLKNSHRLIMGKSC